MTQKLQSNSSPGVTPWRCCDDGSVHLTVVDAAVRFVPVANTLGVKSVYDVLEDSHQTL